MSRVPELYIPSEDEAARAEGSVYIADLMASHVLLALKQNCAPQGLGFIHAEPVTPEAVNKLHGEMSDVLSAPRERLRSGLYIGPMSVRTSYDNPDEVTFSVDYWDGRPMKTSITTGPNLDPTLLTGFKPFDPWGFDRDQGAGQAQKSIDALRATGDSMSMEVQALEGGRAFERAKTAQDLAMGLMSSALKGEENPELGIALSEALDRIHLQTED